MSKESLLQRREAMLGLAGMGAMLAGACTVAQAQKAAPAAATPKASSGHEGHAMKDAAPAAALTAQHKAVIESTAECARKGRVCLARCTDHLAAGTDMMALCQRAVMNMLAVVSAMADVAGYANAKPEQIKALASACAKFCRGCAEACEPHASHHIECKECMEACLTCAKACESLAA